jgi:WD40 repeat protein
MLLRRQGDHLEGTTTSKCGLGENQRALAAHCVRYVFVRILFFPPPTFSTQSIRYRGPHTNSEQYSPAPPRTARSPFSHSKVPCGSPFPSPQNLTRTHLEDGQWGADVFEAHAIGCNAVSWAPAARAGSLLAPNAGGRRPSPVKRFASAGCDNIVKIWGFSEETQAWVEEDVLEGHTDWVRDVAWAPNIGLPRSYIATASQVRSFCFSTEHVY